MSVVIFLFAYKIVFVKCTHTFKTMYEMFKSIYKPVTSMKIAYFIFT